ncbi:uncharacterized protein ASCRUDRAFT_136234 [Ascoidea rubescens DSM 1968]|uniref:Uncharacterized protein n=1 Tax=Ascoidea rubescens DSM 1968 TaxID=1344418 RepID=A0A1D2VLT5_9ASCO|nr:hypothetical protein ASCRUDRAFT_136234 [Ascoidea rubescens DSM 1968]ODV62566.1 hypothetical protein ASCRUDRAFT_136234 [Ascoidea rubescens DSM 1968]
MGAFLPVLSKLWAIAREARSGVSVGNGWKWMEMGSKTSERRTKLVWYRYNEQWVGIWYSMPRHVTLNYIINVYI